MLDADILRIRQRDGHVLIGPGAAFGFRHGFSPKSGHEVHALLRQQLTNEGSLHGLRHRIRRWNVDLGQSNTDDSRLIDLTVAAVEVGRLHAYGFAHTPDLTTLIPDRKQAAVILQEFIARGDRADRPGVTVGKPAARSYGVDRLSARHGPAAGRGTVRIETWPLEVRIAEVVRRATSVIDDDEADLLKPRTLAQVVAVLAVWARHGAEESFALSALLLADRTFLSAYTAFDAAAAITRTLELTSSAGYDRDLDEAAQPLARIIDELSALGFLAVIDLGARRLSMPAAKQSLKLRDYQTRPPPTPRYTPPPSPDPPPPLKSAPPPTPTDTPECAKAKQELQKLQNLRKDASIADAAYTDEEDRPELEEYDALITDKDLAQIGLKKGDLEIPEKAFRAVVYKNRSDGSYVVGFQGSTLSIDDWINNISQGLNLDSAHQPDSYYSRSQYIAKKISAKFPNSRPPPVRFVGHSLGGGLASAAARAIGADASTFNAAGLNPRTVENVIEGGNIIAMSVKGEVLTTLQRLTPLPDAVGDEVLNLEPSPNLARDLLPIIGKALGSYVGLAAGIALRSGLLHKMENVNDSLDIAGRSASLRKDRACGKTSA